MAADSDLAQSLANFHRYWLDRWSRLANLPDLISILERMELSPQISLCGLSVPCACEKLEVVMYITVGNRCLMPNMSDMGTMDDIAASLPCGQTPVPC